MSDLPPITTYSKTVAANEIEDSAYISGSHLTGVTINVGASAFFGNYYDTWMNGYQTVIEAYSGGIGSINLTNGNEARLNADIYSNWGIGAVNIKTGAGTLGLYGEDGVDAYFVASGGGIGGFTVQANGASAYAEVDAYAAWNIGNITLLTNGESAEIDFYGSAAYGPIGLVTHTQTGVDSDGYLYLTAGYGSIGGVNANIKGASAYFSGNAYAYGNVGGVTINLTGDDAEASAYVSAYGSDMASGSIGNILLSQTGNSGDINADFYANDNIGTLTIKSVGASGEDDVSAYAGGNIGNITLSQNGGDNDMYLWAAASGAMGNIAATSIAEDGYFSAYFSAGAIGNIMGNFTGASANGYIFADSDANIGTITITAKGDDGYRDVSAYAGEDGAGNIGNIVMNLTGDSGGLSGYFNTSGNIGNISYTGAGAEASGDISAFTFDTTTGNVGNVTVKQTGYSANFSAWFDLDGNIGTISVSNAGAQASADVSAYAGEDGSGKVGNITLNNNGASAAVSAYVDTSGSVGNISIINAGFAASADIDVYAWASGSIGTIAMSQTTGQSADIDGYFSADGNIGAITITNKAPGGDVTFDASAYSGNIGAITVNQAGYYNYFSGAASAHAYTVASGSGFDAVGGNIGNITLNGTGADADMDIYAAAYGNYWGGGDIGNVAITVAGHSASAWAGLTAYSGDIGTVTLKLNNAGLGSGDVGVSAYVDGAEGRISTIGNVSMTVANTGGSDNSAYFSGYAASGNIGTITGAVNGGTSGHLTVYAYAYSSPDGGGNIGNITLNNSSYSSDTYLYAAADTKIGNVVATVGAGNGDFSAYFSGSADVGTVTVTFAATNGGSAGGLYFDMSTDAAIGQITLKGGGRTTGFAVDGAEGAVAQSVAGVDASLFNGMAYVDLFGVLNGTTVKGGTGDDWIFGTQGADTITGNKGADELYGGLGADTFVFNAGDSTVGTLGDVNKSITVVNSDVIYAATGDKLNLTAAVGTDANYDGLVQKGVGDDISLTLATKGTIEEWVGTYDGMSGKFTSGAGSDALYLFAATDAGTTSTQMIVVVGVGLLADEAMVNGVLTIPVLT